jgi:hypothetical protein
MRQKLKAELNVLTEDGVVSEDVQTYIESAVISTRSLDPIRVEIKVADDNELLVIVKRDGREDECVYSEML